MIAVRARASQGLLLQGDPSAARSLPRQREMDYNDVALATGAPDFRPETGATTQRGRSPHITRDSFAAARLFNGPACVHFDLTRAFFVSSLLLAGVTESASTDLETTLSPRGDRYFFQRVEFAGAFFPAGATKNGTRTPSAVCRRMARSAARGAR